MAVTDNDFAGVSVVQVDGASTTEGDLRGYISAAFVVAASGAAATAISFEESDDGSSYTAIADADLLFSDTDGTESQGTPADSKIADGDSAIVRYRGVARYIRGSATGATVQVLRGTAERVANPDNAVAP